MTAVDRPSPSEVDTGDERVRRGDVALGDDWISPDETVEEQLLARRARRGGFSLRHSPLTRKIVTFNLIALNILVAGLLYLNASSDDLNAQRAISLISDAKLIADVFELQAPQEVRPFSEKDAKMQVSDTLGALRLRQGVDAYVFGPDQQLLGHMQGTEVVARKKERNGSNYTLISDGLSAIWSGVNKLASPTDVPPPPPLADQLGDLVPKAMAQGTQASATLKTVNGSVFVAMTAILRDGASVGTVALVSPSGEIDALARAEREQVLRMFVVATLVSIGLSLVLASTIANPLSDLATAAELGRDRDARNVLPGRVRIPDLTARPDEIGRLSRALRGMVSALYNRIDANEQFAADVAHEIKNPLASLRSAVGTLRLIKREDQKEKLLDVIDHDVRRLDRLVSDISNASRLDSELVKEEETEFDLLTMLNNLNQYLGEDAKSKDIDYITDMPPGPILIHGLEPRLAQVFVNLITNAISFCSKGDAIRVWSRKREARVLVVIEDTGPGIPDEALSKIFKRFYSQRPEEHFGNNSGLGLAISKQIVEAHGGVIWAENIRPADADLTSKPLGARFVVGLPV